MGDAMAAGVVPWKDASERGGRDNSDVPIRDNGCARDPLERGRCAFRSQRAMAGQSLREMANRRGVDRGSNRVVIE